MLGILQQVSEKRGVIYPPAKIHKYLETSEIALTNANDLMPPVDATPDRPLTSIWFVPQFRKEFEKCGVAIRVQSDRREASQEFEASYLVGADGAKGLVRKILNLDFLGKTIDADVSMVVVGDAAHIHSPHGGQGLNTSVQDSVCPIFSVLHDHSSPNAFSDDSQKALTSAAHPKELFQFNINYRWSSILFEDRNPQTASPEEFKTHAYLD
ncbi:hypothetical protein C8J56DRAFT_1061668 [Mycena floridula]|nr:hypothetical protein C8J56DRAFT_1061668 [Mycena floridula]